MTPAFNTGMATMTAKVSPKVRSRSAGARFANRRACSASSWPNPMIRPARDRAAPASASGGCRYRRRAAAPKPHRRKSRSLGRWHGRPSGGACGVVALSIRALLRRSPRPAQRRMETPIPCGHRPHRRCSPISINAGARGPSQAFTATTRLPRGKGQRRPPAPRPPVRNPGVRSVTTFMAGHGRMSRVAGPDWTKGGSGERRWPGAALSTRANRIRRALGRQHHAGCGIEHSDQVVGDRPGPRLGSRRLGSR